MVWQCTVCVCPQAGVKQHGVTDGIMQGGWEGPSGRQRDWVECGDRRSWGRRASCVSDLGRQAELLFLPVLSARGPVCWRVRAWLCPRSHGGGSAVRERGPEAWAGRWPWAQPRGACGAGSGVPRALRP